MRVDFAEQGIRFLLVVLGLLVHLFGCQEALTPAEISIDISPVYVGIRSTSPDTGPVQFDLQLINRGEEVLEIESMEVRGDQRCSFRFDGPDRMVLGENEASFIRGWYQPTVPGDDQIALEIVSNSHIDSPLIVPVCGRGVAPGTTDAGAPPSCNVPPPDQADCPDEE